MHTCVQAANEAHRGPRDLYDLGAAPSGWGRLVS
jgi:hypothetical protein